MAEQSGRDQIRANVATDAPRYTSPDAARIGANSLPLSLPLNMSSATKAAKTMPAKVGHHCSELGHTRA
jgi:hypothetical protein